MNRASTILFWFSITLLVSLGLYHTSYRVDRLTKKIQTVNAQIRKEQRNIHILKAEWVYLSTPARIEKIARKKLDLEPTKTQQFSSLRKLARRLPTKREAVAHARKMAARGYKYHPIAATPRTAASEKGRVNRRLVIGDATSSYSNTEDGPYKVGSLGGAP